MYKLIVIVGLIILSTLPGCVKDTISEDTEFLHDLAANHSVEIGSIEHYGDMVIVELLANHFQRHRDYINALNNSKHFLQDARILTSLAAKTVVKIFLLPDIRSNIEKVEVETISKVKNTISGDIKFLSYLAAEHSVELKSVEHYGDMVFVELSADDSHQYKDFLNKLNDSEHFFQDARILSNPSGSWKAKIFLQSNVEPDIDKILELPDRPSECYDLHIIKLIDDLEALVIEIAKYHGITVYVGEDLSITSVNLDVMEHKTFAIVSCEFPFEISMITDKNSGFLSSLDNLRIPIILIKVVTNARGPVIGLDYYAYCGGR
ncbi:hypothetical protein ACFLXY_08160 [Chloroflexota bacterium]